MPTEVTTGHGWTFLRKTRNKTVKYDATMQHKSPTGEAILTITVPIGGPPMDQVLLELAKSGRTLRTLVAAPEPSELKISSRLQPKSRLLPKSPRKTSSKR